MPKKDIPYPKRARNCATQILQTSGFVGLIALECGGLLQQTFSQGAKVRRHLGEGVFFEIVLMASK